MSRSRLLTREAILLLQGVMNEGGYDVADLRPRPDQSNFPCPRTTIRTWFRSLQLWLRAAHPQRTFLETVSWPEPTESECRSEGNHGRGNKCTEHLAVERTFLALVRTSIAIISLGFVVAKFGVWLRELASRADPKLQVHSTGMSLPMGIGMMAFGGILTVLAVWHCHVVHRAIDRCEVRANRSLVVIVTAVVALLAVLMIVYMLLAARSQ